jgi:ABC-type transport system involved in cytochrome c biogenesis permease subunit
MDNLPEIETLRTPRQTSAFDAFAGLVRPVLKPIASLRLTVVLFALSIGLVFFGTLAQMNAGIWTVVEKYFWSWYVMVEWQLLVQVGQKFFGIPTNWQLPGRFPFPAAKSIGAVMFVNLLAAHFLQLLNLVGGVLKTAQKGKAFSEVVRVLLKRSGIYILHGGIILLFVGEAITRTKQVEQRMIIREGSTVNYAFDTRDYELAFALPVPGDPNSERVTVIPYSHLKKAADTRQRITHDDLPVDVDVVEWMVNHKLIDLKQATPEQKEKYPNPATKGLGTVALAQRLDEGAGTDTEQTLETPAAYVRFYKKGANEDLGTYLVSTVSPMDQAAKAGDTEFGIDLRFKRLYKPFSMRLDKFTHELYLGTKTPKNYASKLWLDDPERGEAHEVNISMNAPLRYRGEAFFQAGFDETAAPGAVQTTFLQVVRNPGWFLPYLSCVLVTGGMILHFLIVLIPFLRRQIHGGARKTVSDSDMAKLDAQTRPEPEGPKQPWMMRWMPAFAVGLGVLMVLGTLAPAPKDANGLDFSDVRATPVVEDGRLKPLDSAARVYLRQLNKRETFTDDRKESRSAIQWYLDSAVVPPQREWEKMQGVPPAFEQKMFRIENLELLDLLKLERRDGLRYSFKEFAPQIIALKNAAVAARSVNEKQRTPYEQKVLELWQNAGVYQDLWEGNKPLILPPLEGGDWRTRQEAEMVQAKARQDVMRDFLKDEDIPADLTVDDLKEVIQNMAPAKRERLMAAIDKAGNTDPALTAWEKVLDAYKRGDAKKFEAATAEYRKQANAHLSGFDRFRIKLEVFLNHTGWYYTATFFYGFILLLSLVGLAMLAGAPELSKSFRRSAFWLMFFTFIVHTFTLFARMFIMDRPLVFVTNLYSSSVFIGWAAVGVCLMLEVMYKIGLGNLVGAIIGLGTCIVSHNLAASGDTLEMMRAVLDTNFWLATHVTTVTFGYSATYVAGLIGLVYLILGIFTRLLGERRGNTESTVGQAINKALYGVICTAMLFSFVGTVLGGIWADQSWGRFWGWDPKENGAVLIVIWNALILHARWCGMVKTRGMAILALIGNMITTWSWFGTNQLGVGLHAYGFNSTLASFCNVVWATHGAVIMAALAIPSGMWKSNPRTTG